VTVKRAKQRFHPETVHRRAPKELGRELDAMSLEMQEPGYAEAMLRIFERSPKEIGELALKAARTKLGQRLRKRARTMRL
jgi:hypothetical protein